VGPDPLTHMCHFNEQIGGTRFDAAQIRRTVRLAGATLAQVREKKRSRFAHMPSVVTWMSPRRLSSPTSRYAHAHP